MKKFQSMIGVALIGAVSLPAFAQQKADANAAGLVATAPGKAAAASTVTITAVVESVDKAQRQVVVKGPRGNVQALTAGPDVRNFDQIKVGDMVAVKYIEALSVALMKDGKQPVGKTVTQGGGTAQPGERPAGAMGRQVEVTANVVGVDAKTQTVTLKGPKQVVDLHVRDPEQFSLVKVGDQIHAVYTEALALSVEPVAPAGK